jgi:O-antigen ligase
MIVDKPLLGHGLGAYNRKLNRGDDWKYTYPHNLVLDLGCEAGLPAALLLITLYVLAFKGVATPLLTRPPGGWLGRALLAVFLLLLFSVLEAMVSNDVFKARYEWGALGLAFAMSVVARRELSSPDEDVGGLPG